VISGGGADQAGGRRALFLVALLSIVASVARTLVGGQDFNFDLVAYHYYLGYSAFVDRLTLDFLPAGYQGYQSPLPYALLYLLDSHGVPPVVNAALHACIHALNLVALFLLVRLLLRGGENAHRRAAWFAFWLLGAAAPVYWRLVGTSFADLATSAPVLAGLWLIARSLPERAGAGSLALPALALGAAFAGAAAGMRIHNAIYVVALACSLAILHFPNPRTKGLALGVFSLGAAGGWLVCFAPWAWRIARQFGNPVFPFWNGVFHSPDFPAANLPLTGFVPESLADLLTLPFRIGTLADWVYIEIPLPDVRPGLLVLAILACGLVWAYRRIAGGPVQQGASPQAARLIITFFFAAAILWLATSAHGRYGVALFLLGGPVCGVLLQRVLPMRFTLLVIAAVVLWQALLQQIFFNLYRPDPGPWSARYFDWDMPDRMRREAAVYLGFHYKTASSLAPQAHPESRHVNLVGQYSPGVDGPGNSRIRQIIDASGKRIYGVFDFNYTQQPDPASESIKFYFKQHLHLWGLDFKDQPCTLIALKPASGGWDRLNRAAAIKFRGRPPAFMLCELQPSSSSDRAKALLEYQQFQRKLSPLAATCPQFFGKPLSFVRGHDTWEVMSFASFEVRLEFQDQGEFQLRQNRPPYVEVALGAVTRDSIIPREPDCNKWFSALRQMSAQAARR